VERNRALATASLAAAALALSCSPASEPAAESPQPAGAPAFAFTAKPGAVDISFDGRPVALYVYEDPKTFRPYLAHVKAPDGTQVTRNHPPVEGQDKTDHAEFHPGLWMSFGDVSGADFHRNKAKVEHVRFLEDPRGGPGAGGFRALNNLVTEEAVIGELVVDCHLRALKAGTLIVLGATFRALHEPLVLGDQEEMGLGVRVATPLAVENGGSMLSDHGGRDEKGTWGTTAAWLDYAGEIDGKPQGVMIVPDPGNFRPSWMHSRDYGVVMANPFGRNAMTGGEKSAVPLPPGEALGVRWGVLLHSGPFDPEAGAAEALEALAAVPSP
jgi:hypothetical protein